MAHNIRTMTYYDHTGKRRRGSNQHYHKLLALAVKNAEYRAENVG